MPPAEFLVGGNGFAVDASLIAGDANKERSLPGNTEWKAADIGPLGLPCRTRVPGSHSMMPRLAKPASESIPKFISPSDLAANSTGDNKGHAFFAYATNYLIDLNHAIIV